MHTFWARVNTVLTFAGSIAAVLCVLVTLTDFALGSCDPPVTITLNEVKRLAPTARDGQLDQAALALSLDADLTGCFAWNTKQLFVFLMAEYATQSYGVNQVVLWDRIVTSRGDAHIALRGVRQKYAFIDRGAGLRGTPLNVTLAWNVMPRVGRLAIRQKTVAVAPLPEEYTADAAAAAEQEQEQQQHHARQQHLQELRRRQQQQQEQEQQQQQQEEQDEVDEDDE